MKNKGCAAAAVVGGVILVIIIAIAGWGVSKYNSLVTKDQAVQKVWGDVETVYQKRANLIPNLERTVKSYAKFEKETLTSVVEARAKATSVNIDPTNMTEADLQKFQAAQGQLSGALGRLMMVVEKYPDLKADQQYINFQREYTAIENSIRMETVNYNAAAQSYNTYRNVFPNNVVANFTNFKEKPYFKADAGAEKAPEAFQDNE
ncbi:LemA family protein [Elizabethkingia sp. JS20170427COW]|uniref:LemA family protein n=1 Tax=Elizabethkingia sp. JS20170427COW TaxID=2583851 RepID=UPI001110AF7E|nr:LemA family protein [Elizabethkingia sp. JS20170427COW]QCX52864.1 LemA family protein [Elizabethkingia sp. JS20170427COW]